MTNLQKRINGILATINQSDLSEEEKERISQQVRSIDSEEEFNSLVKQIQERLEALKETTDNEAREKAEEISRGEREPEHLGRHTKESLEQELFSLANTKPMFRNSKWIKRYETVVMQIDKIKEENLKKSLRARAQAIWAGEI